MENGGHGWELKTMSKCRYMNASIVRTPATTFGTIERRKCCRLFNERRLKQSRCSLARHPFGHRRSIKALSALVH